MLQFNIQESLLQNAALSKFVVSKGTQLPSFKQARVLLKADAGHNSILNLVLASCNFGRFSKFALLNRKQSFIVPGTLLNGLTLKS
jgi:hypothetical protein